MAYHRTFSRLTKLLKLLKLLLSDVDTILWFVAVIARHREASPSLNHLSPPSNHFIPSIFPSLHTSLNDPSRKV
jgi:hypothetical protein